KSPALQTAVQGRDKKTKPNLRSTHYGQTPKNEIPFQTTTQGQKGKSLRFQARLCGKNQLGCLG
ncbi:MAG: hypothetical protein V6Z82_03330, partial [Flavobacteriales bacterium]